VIGQNSPPIQVEIALCEEGDRIVGVGGLRSSSMTYLRFFFRNGDTQIVSLDDTGAGHLVAVLKALVPSFEAIDQSAVNVSLDDGAISAQSPYGSREVDSSAGGSRGG
jgi:hypothetical protein